MRKELLIVVQKFYPSGAEALVKSLTPTMSENYNLHIVSMLNNENKKEEHDYIKYIEKYNVKYHIINETSHFKRIKELSKYMICNEIQIIHSHSYFPNMYARLASIGKKVQKIVTYHSASNDWNNRKLQWMEKFLDFYTDERIAVSNVPLKYYKKYISKKNKVHVIPNGIHISENQSLKTIQEFRAINNISEDELLFINVGRITPQKNQGMLIELMKELKQSSAFDLRFKLYIIGYKESDLLWNEYERKIKEYDLQDIVILYGSSSEVTLFMQSADLFLFPSLDEAHPIALIEACSNNLLTIASNISANKQTFSNNEIFLEDNKKVDDWKMLIEKIYIEKSFDTKEMINSAKEKVKTSYTIQENAKKYIELYSK